MEQEPPKKQCQIQVQCAGNRSLHRIISRCHVKPIHSCSQWLSELDICFLTKINELLLIVFITDVLFMQI